jgi:Zn-dependent peptidase ImmA (M78 family)/transcriptional regulator with XRE-family HTH domain
VDRVTVKPKLLRWAIERSRVDFNTLVHRFPKLPDWEQGDANPTLKQLESFAKATHTPIGFFFLAEPLAERVPIPDFRRVAGAQIHGPSPDLLDTIYLCQQRQDWYRDYARSTGDEPRGFVGSVRINNDVIATARQIREAIGFDVEKRRLMPTWTDALRGFIELADNLGILVMVSGVVGSNNKRKLDPQEFRGFALADQLAPLVFINGADSKAAQMFTLAHELAHIWLGETAVSDAEASAVPNNAIESWCNRVAAELLVPITAFGVQYARNRPLREELDRLARVYKVSRLVILRRIYDSGGLSRDAFFKAYEAELDHLRALPKGSGGDFYLTLGARASKTFARALVVSTVEGRTPFTEAFRLLGFKKMATFSELGRTLGVAF